jgi:hypothetical protein
VAKTASAKAAKDTPKPRKPRKELSKAHKDLLDVAKRRFKVGDEADTPQRVRELDDLSFYAGGLNQWTKDQQDARKGQAATASLPPLPARPMITINKVRQPVQQVTNNIRQSDFSIEIAAADDFGELTDATDSSKQEIEVREGLTRRIQRASEASDARLWAAIRAAIAGRGYYAVLARFLPGKSWDREVYVHRFYNQASIMLDPAHEMPDGSDANWGFIGVDLPLDDYEAQFGEEDDLSAMTDGEFRALGDDLPGWFIYDKKAKTRTVRVVDYIYAVYEPRVLVQLADGTAAWKDELPAGAVTVDERDVVERTVKWAKLNGLRVLDEPEWESPDIPIIKVLGEELQPFDAERRAEGMVRPARDAQVGFNVMVSKWVETIGLTPVPPLVLDPESIESFEKWYQLASTRTLPFLPARTRDDQGREFREPHAPQAGRPDVIQAMAASVQMFDEAIQSTTGVPDSRLGKNTDSKLKAARAIESLQQQSEQGTSNYADNLKRSVRREGEIINNLLYPIYGKKPGRLVKIIDGQGEPQDVQIGQKPQTPGMPPPQTQRKTYTLTEDATFNINIKVTKDPGTRREEESTFIAHLLDANPMFMTWFGDLFFKNQDGPGHAAMEERAKVMLDPKIQQMMAAKDSGTTLPPEIATQLAAKDQQIQHAEAAMKQLHDAVQSKQMENDTRVKIAQMDNETKLQIAAKDREVKLGVAELGAKVDRLELFMQESQLVGARTHEAAMAAADAGHEEHMANLAHAQGVAATQQQQGGQAVLADQGHAQALEQGDQGHQQALEQGQQAADLALPPADGGAE